MAHGNGQSRTLVGEAGGLESRTPPASGGPVPADPVASAFTPPSRPARPLARPRGWDFLLRRFVRDHGVPVVLAALFVELQHARWITIVPVAPTLVIGSGRAGLLLAAVAAFVASSAFIRENQDYGVGSFLLTVVVAFALLPPIISDPFRYALGLRPPQIQIVLVFVYLGLHLAAGIFIGGLWTVVVKTFYR